MFKSLRSRLVISHIVIILVCLGLAGAGALLFLRGYQRNAIYNRLTDRGDFASFASTLLLKRDGSEKAAIQRLTQLLNRRGGAVTHVYLLGRDGKVIAGSDDRLAGLQFQLPPADGGDSASRLLQGERRLGKGQRLLYVVLPVRSPLETASEPTGYALVLGEFYRPVILALDDLLPRLLWAGLIALGLSMILAAWMARSIAQPLGHIVRASEEVSAGNYGQSLDITAPTEIARLAASFSHMARQVQHTLQSQQDLLVNVSHELKTPLTSIQGFSQALVDGTAREPSAQKRAAQVISEEAGRMRRLVDELLDLARLESGQFALKRQPIDTAHLLEGCATRFALQAHETRCEIIVEATGAPGTIMGDSDRLDQVLDNLVDNAIKHACAHPGEGKIVLRSERSEPWICLSVTDNGPGIANKDLARLFERFFRADKSRSRRTFHTSSTGRSGAGLGLAISQEIAKAHGGHIRAESVEGLGTRFTVCLPSKNDALAANESAGHL